MTDQPGRPPRSRDGAGFAPVRALAADLRDLGVDLEAGSYTGTTLAMFRRNLLRAVPSALGATIRVAPVDGEGLPVEIHLVDRVLAPDEIESGLLLSLSQVRESLVGSVMLYAGVPDAFGGLVDDLRAAVHADGHEIDEHPPLPTTPVTPSIDGLENFSLVNRALGVLLSRGLSLAEARVELAERALRERTDLPHAAQRLLSVYR